MVNWAPELKLLEGGLLQVSEPGAVPTGAEP